MKTTTRFAMRPIARLKANVHNARLHDDAQIEKLRESMRRFGFVVPLLIDGSDTIVCGDARLAAAKAEGLPEVPCVLVEHLDEVERRAYAMADNRLAELADWDAQLVSQELQYLQEAGFDLSLTGFDESDIILTESTDTHEDDAFDPTPPGEPAAKRGEIYALGRHRIMCGDATDKKDVAALMAGNLAQLLLTDPPYNVQITGQTDAALTICNDDFGADEDGFCDFLHRAFVCALPARSDYHWQHEPCLHGRVEPLPEQDDDGDGALAHASCLYGWTDGRAHLWTADRRQTTVLRFDRPTRSEQHPTMKPVRLFAYLMCNSTRPGAWVADFFAGSGTTVIAAEQTGRTAYAMELDPRYVDVMIARWEQFTGQKAVRLDGPQ